MPDRDGCGRGGFGVGALLLLLKDEVDDGVRVDVDDVLGGGDARQGIHRLRRIRMAYKIQVGFICNLAN